MVISDSRLLMLKESPSCMQRESLPSSAMLNAGSAGTGTSVEGPACTSEKFIQSKLFIMSFLTTEYSVSDETLLRTDLFPLKFPLYNRIFT